VFPVITVTGRTVPSPPQPPDTGHPYDHPGAAQRGNLSVPAVCIHHMVSQTGTTTRQGTSQLRRAVRRRDEWEAQP
jgi:hypothetical protein